MYAPRKSLESPGLLLIVKPARNELSLSARVDELEDVQGLNCRGSAGCRSCRGARPSCGDRTGVDRLRVELSSVLEGVKARVICASERMLFGSVHAAICP